MEYTERQKQEFKRQFASIRRKQMVVSGLLIIVMIPYVTANESTGMVLGTYPIAMVVPVFFVVVIGALVFSFRNWRCPACNKYLGRSLNPHYCWKCGIALR